MNDEEFPEGIPPEIVAELEKKAQRRIEMVDAIEAREGPGFARLVNALANLQALHRFLREQGLEPRMVNELASVSGDIILGWVENESPGKPRKELLARCTQILSQVDTLFRKI